MNSRINMSLIDQLLDKGSPTSSHPVSVFLESKASIERFVSHFRRTSNKLMQKYVSTVSSMLESYTKFPTDAGGSLIAKTGSDCKAIVEASQKGERERVNDLLPEAYSRASGFKPMLESFGPIGMGTSGTMLEDARFEDEHNAFCKKFCKEFKVEADHHESVAEGLFIYFDAENTDTLSRNLQFDISNFCFENGYILLKSGSVDDFSFGSFGEELSKWGFVYLSDYVEN
jgi:hypothetical protein